MALDLSAPLELLGDDDQSEVCLGRCAAGHRFVVLVKVRVIVDLDAVSKLVDELQWQSVSAAADLLSLVGEAARIPSSGSRARPGRQTRSSRPGYQIAT